MKQPTGFANHNFITVGYRISTSPERNVMLEPVCSHKSQRIFFEF